MELCGHWLLSTFVGKPWNGMGLTLARSRWIFSSTCPLRTFFVQRRNWIDGQWVFIYAFIFLERRKLYMMSSFWWISSRSNTILFGLQKFGCASELDNPDLYFVSLERRTCLLTPLFPTGSLLKIIYIQQNYMIRRTSRKYNKNE